MDQSSGPATPEGRKRKQDLEAALRLLEVSQAKWARSRGTSKANLSLILSEKRSSDRRVREVDAFVAAVKDCLRRHCGTLVAVTVLSLVALNCASPTAPTHLTPNHPAPLRQIAP